MINFKFYILDLLIDIFDLLIWIWSNAIRYNFVVRFWIGLKSTFKFGWLGIRIIDDSIGSPNCLSLALRRSTFPIRLRTIRPADHWTYLDRKTFDPRHLTVFKHCLVGIRLTSVKVSIEISKLFSNSNRWMNCHFSIFLAHLSSELNIHKEFLMNKSMKNEKWKISKQLRSGIQ